MSNRYIIIADLDRDLRSAMRMQLDALGFICFIAADATEAVERTGQFLPKLVLLDTELPQLGAYAACAQIKRLAGCQDVPVVLVSLMDRPQIRAAAATAGANAVLLKPFSVGDLLRQLEPYIVNSNGPAGRAAWRDIGHGAVGAGMAEPPRNVWSPAARQPLPAPRSPALTQGLQLLDVLRRREASRDRH